MKHLILGLLFLPIALSAQEFDPLEYIKSNYNNLSDSLILQNTFDSLELEMEQWGEGINLHSVNLNKSKDGRMKIFQFIGEGCGAYCNPIYEYVAVINDRNIGSKRFYKGDLKINFEIDSIVNIIPDYYLIFGMSSGRPRGIESAWGSSVSLVNINSDFEIKWEFSALTSNLVEVDSPKSELEYDPINRLLKYQYDSYDEFDDFRSFQLIGTWKFTNETFNKINERKVYWPEKK